MPPRRAPQPSAAGRDRLVPIGLSSDELELLRRAARGLWDIASDLDVPPVPVGSEHEDETVVVVGLDWLEAASERTTHRLWLHEWSGVVLVPATAAGERQRWLAHRASRAHIVLTGFAGTLESLHDALVRVRHEAVASLLASRLGQVHSTLVTRALIAALFLDPQRADVASLARSVHMHQRTLRRQLAVTCPRAAPQRLLGWARLLHAGWRLRDPARTVDEVGRSLHFSAAANLHRMFREYADSTPQRVRERPGTDPVAVLIARMRIDLERAN